MRTIMEWETNKNAVLFWFQPMCDRPYGCVVSYYGWRIYTTIYRRGFSVCNDKISKHFSSLSDAKNFIHEQVNKNRTLWDFHLIH